VTVSPGWKSSIWSSVFRSISDAASMSKFFRREKTPRGVDVFQCRSLILQPKTVFQQYR
jgi:hypothetical protein